MGSPQSAPTSRIPVKLPVSFGSRPYLTGFGFKVTNDVAVAMMRQPYLTAKARVWAAVMFGAIQDANQPAIYWHGEDSGVEAGIPIARLIEATGLSRSTVYRVLSDLNRSGSIHWNLGNARRAPTFAVCLNPPPPASKQRPVSQEAETASVSSRGTLTVSRDVFKPRPVQRGKERKEEERSPNDSQERNETERTTNEGDALLNWLAEDDSRHGRVPVSQNEAIDTHLIDLQFGNPEQRAEFVRRLQSA